MPGLFVGDTEHRTPSIEHRNRGDSSNFEIRTPAFQMNLASGFGVRGSAFGVRR